MSSKESQAAYYERNKEKLDEDIRAYMRSAEYTYFYKTYVKPLVLQRDGACTECGVGENLVVHHLHYDMSRLTFYDLVTLCKSCHKKEHSKLAV